MSDSSINITNVLLLQHKNQKPLSNRLQRSSPKQLQEKVSQQLFHRQRKPQRSNHKRPSRKLNHLFHQHHTVSFIFTFDKLESTRCSCLKSTMHLKTGYTNFVFNAKYTALLQNEGAHLPSLPLLLIQ